MICVNFARSNLQLTSNPCCLRASFRIPLSPSRIAKKICGGRERLIFPTHTLDYCRDTPKNPHFLNSVSSFCGRQTKNFVKLVQLTSFFFVGFSWGYTVKRAQIKLYFHSRLMPGRLTHGKKSQQRQWKSGWNITFVESRGNLTNGHWLIGLGSEVPGVKLILLVLPGFLRILCPERSPTESAQLSFTLQKLANPSDARAYFTTCLNTASMSASLPPTATHIRIWSMNIFYWWWRAHLEMAMHRTTAKNLRDICASFF